MHVIAIVNPISGAGMDPGVATRRVELLRTELARRHVDATVQLTAGPGHARALAAAAVAAGAPLVIVWGGDGTLNEAGAGLIGSATTLGIIRAGSGNGLAAALAIPREPNAALAVALGPRTWTVDAGMLAGRPFFNVAGIGLDARIATEFNRRSRGARGRWPYVAIGVREGCRYRGETYDVQLDGEARRHRALLIVFANGQEFGMGARIAPAAQLDDGLLDAVIVEDRSLLARVWHARYLAIGSVDRAPHVVVRKVRRAVVESSGPMEFHVDGEPGTADRRIEIEIMSRALKVKAGWDTSGHARADGRPGESWRQ